MGSKDKEGMARVHFCTAPGAEEVDSGVKEWKQLDDIRPVPPEPPEEWQTRLRMYDVVDVRHEDGWVEATYLETLLPSREDGMVLHVVRKLGDVSEVRLPGSQLRPLWALNSETRLWSLTSRRTGPSSSVLLTLRLESGKWQLAEQQSAPGPVEPFNPEQPREPTALEQTV